MDHSMRSAVEIEDIGYMRRCSGIEDKELEQDIRGLRVGDLVKLTFLSGERSFETLSVQITSIRRTSFRGKLAKKPTAVGLSSLRLGSPVAFTASHVHSIPRKIPNS
jgi:hypothetical protein